MLWEAPESRAPIGEQPAGDRIAFCAAASTEAAASVGDRVIVPCASAYGSWNYATTADCTRPAQPPNVGVHGTPEELNLQDLWIHNLSIAMGLRSTSPMPMLLNLVKQHRLPAEKFVTHCFTFREMLQVYETFGDAATSKALKVLISWHGSVRLSRWASSDRDIACECRSRQPAITARGRRRGIGDTREAG